MEFLLILNLPFSRTDCFFGILDIKQDKSNSFSIKISSEISFEMFGRPFPGASVDFAFDPSVGIIFDILFRFL